MGGSQSIPTTDTNIYNCKPSYLHLKDKYVNINTIVDTSSIDIKNHVDLRTNAPPISDMGSPSSGRSTRPRRCHPWPSR